MKQTVLLILAVFAALLSITWVVDNAYKDGYLQGYEEGQKRAQMSPESLRSCAKLWFESTVDQTKQAIDQYCDWREK